MKTFGCVLKFGNLPVLCLLVLLSGVNVFAQAGNPIIPMVTIRATGPVAWGPDNPGTFMVFRAGDTNAALNVYYLIGGTAANGVDYAPISSLVALPAGVISNSITITPLTNPPPTGVAKTVVLTLTNSPFMTPVNYEIGSPSSATVIITAPGVTNLPPVVALISPANGQVFYAPTNILLMAKAADPDGTVTNVEFFAGTNDLGGGFPVVLDPPGVGGITGLVYLLNWQNMAASHYSLTAVATDNGGVARTSQPVAITVLPGPPPTNLPPVVRITSPPNGAVFRAPVNLPIYAYASDPDGRVSTVEFFAGINSLGFGRPVAAVPPPLPPGPVQPPILMVASNYWALVWTNATLGTNLALTAKATDNGGLSATSQPVLVSVLPSLPPPTNRPAIVSIVATDPVAIEGTNCWSWPGLTNSPPTWSNWAGASAALLPRFTNCGPKNATLAVFRSGTTNDDMNVSYSISGTASNGVDYIAISTNATILAGQLRAAITIVPLDDGPPDVNKTVILTLTASTNYTLGIPRRAAAIIIDNGGPRPVAALLPGNNFHLATSGPDTAWFCVECSTNLINWQPVCTNQVINGSIDYVDPDASGNPSRFYRAVPLTGPAPE